MIADKLFSLASIGMMAGAILVTILFMGYLFKNLD